MQQNKSREYSQNIASKIIDGSHKIIQKLHCEIAREPDPDFRRALCEELQLLELLRDMG